MRGRLYNNEFFMAGYSFSFLSKYYGHVVSRLDDAADIIKESGRERDQAHREKGLQYDRKGQENFEKIYAEIWAGVFPQFIPDYGMLIFRAPDEEALGNYPRRKRGAAYLG